MNRDPRSDAKLNRIIAEWIGWEVISGCGTEDSSIFYSLHCPKGFQVGRLWVKEDWAWRQVPSYCTDLNAITEAVRKLGGDDQSLWYDTLAMECPEDPESDIAQMRWLTQWFVAVEATPRQRAEALVYVIESKRK